MEFWVIFSASELPALLLLAVGIVAQRRAVLGRRQLFVYGVAMLQLALPALMSVSALNAQGSNLLSWVSFCLYLLQFHVGFFIALLLAYRVAKTKHLAIMALLSASLLVIQMFSSFYLMLLETPK